MSATLIHIANGLTPQNRSVLPLVGGVLQDHAPNWPRPYVCLVNNQPVLRADWQRPVKANDIVVFMDADMLLQNGGGGSNPLRVVLMIAVASFAPGIGTALAGKFAAVEAIGGITYGAIAGAAVGLVGSALVNAIVPPPKPPSNRMGSAAAAASPTYDVGAQANQARLNEAIPEHFGRHIAYPDLASEPFAEYEGNEQYLYQLFSLGRGQYDIEQVRIEDTPVANFNEISYEVLAPGEAITLFHAQVMNSAEVGGQELLKDAYVGGFTLQAAGTKTRLIALDFVAPKGIYYANDDGGLSPMEIQVQPEARLIDDNGNALGAWFVLTAGTTYSEWSGWTAFSSGAASDVPADTETAEYKLGGEIILGGAVEIAASNQTNTNPVYGNNGFGLYGTSAIGLGQAPVKRYRILRRTRNAYTGKEVFAGSTATPQRYTKKYTVPLGRYEVRVTRLDEKEENARYGHEVVWAGARAYLEADNNFGDVTLIAMRMRASNNLTNTSSRKVNVIATRKLPVWNGSTWSAPQATRSIAWAFAYVCKQAGLLDAQIDLNYLLWLENNVWQPRGDLFNARFDGFIPFWEAVSKILQAGRAKPYLQGAVMRVYRDQQATVPVALYSMRNIVRGSFSIDYLMPSDDTADAIDAEYFDELLWASRELRAQLPDSSAQKPVNTPFFGITQRLHVHREAMYQVASNRYRRRFIKFSTEMEGFIPSVGDLIAVQHDMVQWGQHAEVVAYDAPSKTMTVSEPMVFGTGDHYVGLRLKDGSVQGPYLVTAGADDYELVFSVAPSEAPYAGREWERTHIAFGAGETWRQPAKVLSIMPRGEHLVEINAINEDNRVHSAESGVIPPAINYSQLPKYTTRPQVYNVIARPVRGSSVAWEVFWDRAPWADEYVIESSADGQEWTRAGVSSGNNAVVNSRYGRESQFRVAAIGGAQGDWVLAQPDITPPDDVDGLTLNGDGFYFSRAKAVDLDGYKLRFNYGVNRQWANAIPLHDGLVTDSPYFAPSLPTGQVTYLIKAVDTSGNESTNAASYTVNMGDALVDNVIYSIDYQAIGWPGTLTNCTDIAGNLVANQIDSFYESDTGLFYGLAGAPFYTDTYDGLTWQSPVYRPSGVEIGANMTLNFAVNGDSYNIEYRLTGTEPFYAEGNAAFYGADNSEFYQIGNGDWLAWRSSLITEAGDYQFRVTTKKGSTSGVVSDFTLNIDVPDVMLSLSNISIASGGTRITGAIGRFIAITNIQMNLRTGSTANVLETIDYNPTLGPLVIAKNGTTPVAATIDAILQGY